MKILAAKRVEDCFDGSRVVRYFLDAAWTTTAIRRLGALGELEYCDDFPRPLFRVVLPDGAEIKGVEGESDCQVVYPQRNREGIQARIEGWFER